MTAPQALVDLTRAGVSIWLDDLDRGRIASGDLARLIDDDEVLSLTTTVVMASMDRDALGEALLAGVEQAARLAVVTEALLADPDESTTEPERPTFDQLRV